MIKVLEPDPKSPESIHRFHLQSLVVTHYTNCHTFSWSKQAWLSESHTSRTTLHTCVYVCLLAPHTVIKFSTWFMQYLNVSRGTAFPYLCPVNLLTGEFLNPLPIFVLWHSTASVTTTLKTWSHAFLTYDKRALHLWPCNELQEHISTCTVLLYIKFLAISHMLHTFDSLNHLPFFVLWYSAASATMRSQLMVCVH